MADPGFNNPDDDTTYNPDPPPTSSGLDPGVEEAIIINVVVWVCLLAFFAYMWIYCRPGKGRHAKKEHDLVMKRLSVLRSQRKTERDAVAAAMELGGLNAPHGDGRMIGLDPPLEPSEESSVLSPLQPVQAASVPSRVEVVPSLQARIEEPHHQPPSMISRFRNLFGAKEAKAKGKDTPPQQLQGRDTNTKRTFGIFFAPRRSEADVAVTKKRTLGDEESLMGLRDEEFEEQEKAAGVHGVVTNNSDGLPRRSSSPWVSEGKEGDEEYAAPPPVYSSLADA